MPRVKSQNPKSLKKLCAEFVASNLDHWCNSSSSEDEINKCDQEATLSQFDKLPSVLLEEVLHLVRCLLEGSSSPDKMKFTKQSFELLITPHLRSLDLSMCDSNDVPYILNLASLRCTDLQTVVCSYNCVDIFVHICAMKFERLQVLNISQTDAEDNCLQILGMYCKDLRELKVEYCKKITDAGIQGLCVSVNHMGKEDQRLGQCKSIETLFISGTRITKKGIQTALINLPFLKQLTVSCDGSDSEVPVQIVAEIHQLDCNLKRLKDIRKYSLESLFLGDWLLYDDTYFPKPMPYTCGSLGLVASICPSVTSVKVKLITGLTDTEMLGLLSLENVNELEIHGNEVINDTVTFEGGVVPLFKGFGSSLKDLTLIYLKDVKIRAIIDFCPKLHSLRLDEIKNYSSTVSAKEDAESCHSKRCRVERKPLVLRNLQKLCVTYPSGEPIISSEDLLSLFSSPSLIDIYIELCDNLTDYIFERASEIHQFLSLEKLTMIDCRYLTRRGIDVVMNKKTPLKTIKIYSCDNITDEDIDFWISNARSEKWELSVKYAPKDEESN